MTIPTIRLGLRRGGSKKSSLWFVAGFAVTSIGRAQSSAVGIAAFSLVNA